MTDGFFSGAGRSRSYIGGKDGFEGGAYLKIEPVLAGVQDAYFAFEVALFANTIAGGRRQLGGIDDGAGYWFLEMRLGGTVAAFARDG
jgi:hypothetical protein